MKVRFFSILAYFFIGLFSGCTGYHFNTNNNPLIGYDIKSVSVPMFINRSVIPDIAGPMTREITLALHDYNGLRVLSGENENADAVLIGVIDSGDHYNDVVITSKTVLTTGSIEKSIGRRSPFYLPIESRYTLSLRLILIKRPTKEEIELLTSDIGKSVKVHPKIVLQDVIALANTFPRVVANSIGPGSPGEVNFTQNRGVFEKSLRETCYQAGQTFKQVVLNAF